MFLNTTARNKSARDLKSELTQQMQNERVNCSTLEPTVNNQDDHIVYINCSPEKANSPNKDPERYNY